MAQVNDRSVLASFGSLIRQDPVRAEINRMISCIKAANYSTVENNAEDTGYSGKESEQGKKPVVIHVVEFVPVEKPVFLGLITREIQQRNPICSVQFDNSVWKIPQNEIFQTEKLSDLYKHLKYYGLKIQLEGASEDILNRIYVEAREARPGAVDRLPASESEKSKN
ncbi:hypothetical protein Mboo_0724 [Methanoregula boonei 6A8]|uniref:Uncharacterized protein n=1 Tax=Methanoregula boonei (strain DSM 21154 / JCM 14090 / 6A8) TaxID=456442 RepID=A7I681_METB6|nr:hypothetical protein [Methanoregula boonei]ABS55242.1 hypothetical protein Mboo_0724 [Methanoregula boonei 6A8]